MAIQPSKNVPMSSAPFIYDSDGKPAWDKMWDAYCNLAAEGGPPHRGEMLRSKGTANNFNSDQYKYAVSEIERAFGQIIPYKFESTNNGYIKVTLKNKNMAKWFSDIINKENVECQVKDADIFLPVNDDFTLEKEIKNVVTVMGKAFHYWSRHRNWFEKLSINQFGSDIKLEILARNRS
jgi:hypothetical protein